MKRDETETGGGVSIEDMIHKNARRFVKKYDVSYEEAEDIARAIMLGDLAQDTLRGWQRDLETRA